MPGLNLALTYAEVDYDATSYEDDKAGAASTDVDEDEIYATLTYQMSDNFRTYVRYGTYDVDSDNNADDLDRDRGRLEVRYSF